MLSSLSPMSMLDAESGAYMQITRCGAAGCSGRSGVQRILYTMRDSCMILYYFELWFTRLFLKINGWLPAAVDEAQGPGRGAACMAGGLQGPLAGLLGRRRHENAARYAISVEGGVQVVIHTSVL